MQFNENILLNAFSNLPFEVRGIGIFKLDDNKVITLAKRVDNQYIRIGLDDGQNSGYLRLTGDAIPAPNGDIDCNTQIYEVTQEIALVIGTNNYTMDSVETAMLFRIANVVGATWKRSVYDRDKIMSEEKLGENSLNLLKIVFDYKYDWAAPCEDNILCEC